MFRLERLQHERTDPEHEQERFVGDPRARVPLRFVGKDLHARLVSAGYQPIEAIPGLGNPYVKKIVCSQLAVTCKPFDPRHSQRPIPEQFFGGEPV